MTNLRKTRTEQPISKWAVIETDFLKAAVKKALVLS